MQMRLHQDELLWVPSSRHKRASGASRMPPGVTCLKVCNRRVGHGIPGVDLRQVQVQRGRRHCGQGRVGVRTEAG